MGRSRSTGMWRTILVGLPAVVIVWLVALVGEQGRIEADLQERAQLSFGQAGLDWARVQVRGRNAYIIGEAYSQQEQKLARRLVGKVWGVAGVTDRSSLAAIQEQYVWTAAVESGAIRLMGYYPNGRTRQNVLSVARELFPERTVTDQMRPARGAPEDGVWLGAIQFGLAQLSRLEQGGRVNLRGRELAVAGVATSIGAYRTIKGALYRQVPEGVVLVKDKVEPPTVSPYTWSAEYKNGQLLLSGYVPGEGDRDALIAVAKQAFKKSPIVDKMAIAAGQPQEWIGAASTIVRQIAQLETASATLTDSSLTFEGIAQKQETAERVRAELRSGLASIYTITQELRFREATIPTMSPFVTSLKFDGRALQLSGSTPNQALADQVLAAAEKARPNMKMTGALGLAKGAPEGWISCVMAGLQALLQLDEGEVHLTDRSLVINGVTRSEEVAEALPKAVRAAANRACTETINLLVKVPPEPNLSWRASFDEDVLRVSGEVPSLAVRRMIIEIAGKLFTKAEFVEELKVVPHRSEKWPKIAGIALESLSKLRRGTASIDGQVLTFTGEAPDTATATAIREQLKGGLAKGYTARTTIEVKSAAMLWAEREARRKAEEAAKAAAARRAEVERKNREAEEAERRRLAEEAEALRIQQRKAEEEAAEKARQQAEEARRRAQEEATRRAEQEERERKARAAAEQERKQALERCQAAIDETMTSGSIVFARGSDKLDERSFPTLDRLIGLRGLCSRLNLEIGGHTDSSGSPDGNQQLSERRAETVRSYLVSNGMPPEQVTARGYGETQPIVPNTTADNRAKNRRIEIRVR